MKGRCEMKNAVLVLAVVTMCSGCASIGYGPFAARTLGKDLKLDNMNWVKTLPDGSKEVISVGTGANSSAEATHAVANIVTAALGVFAGGPAGGAAGFAGAEVWQTLKDVWLKPDPVATSPVVIGVPGTVNDSEASLSLRQAGREVPNDGSVTYLRSILTAKPMSDGWKPVGVQWNDKTAAEGEGERTSWIDKENTAVRTTEIPAALANRIVIWYER